MAILDHWHPVLCSRRLGKRPVAVRLGGKDLVLFRAAAGAIGALEDCCPHRRMRLSAGQVVNQRLQCPYHGWTFDCDGDGESPSTPKLYATAPGFDALERHGAIWLKPRTSQPEFPPFEVEGCYHVCTLQHQIHAPLELVVDNFTEIEHTPTVHGMFGYALDRMPEVEVQFLPTADSVRVVNVGPAKPIPLWLRFLLGVRSRYRFHDDWTTHFSPVYGVYDHWWADARTGREGLVRWRLYIFFVPRDEDSTTVMTFAFTRSRWPGPTGCVALFKWLMVRMLDQEIRLDVGILENLVDKNPHVEGMKLSRFDRVLGLHRERIEAIYRGGKKGGGTQAPVE
ncbi:MAG TPA: Rieske 2Fe-2S domain-containing protein [Gemmataceae bacterium]|nr:Rieske 2Fe-2S domain-containing protein [Gemmataceae bacterium]